MESELEKRIRALEKVIYDPEFITLPVRVNQLDAFSEGAANALATMDSIRTHEQRICILESRTDPMAQDVNAFIVGIQGQVARLAKLHGDVARIMEIFRDVGKS